MHPFLLLPVAVLATHHLPIDVDDIDLPLAHYSQDQPFDHFKDLTFCRITCRGVLHVGCRCNRLYDPDCHAVQPEHHVEFRMEMIKWHNALRNHVASGNESHSYAGAAADMNAVSYDLGLEYLALCTAKKCEDKQDKCRQLKNFPHSGQNLFFQEGHQSVDNFTNFVPHVMQQWYDEIKTLPDEDIIGRFIDGKWRKFTTMMWATVTHIGCAICHKMKADRITILVACNYGNAGGSAAVNLARAPVYKRGKAATQCRSGRKRNYDFPALCGKIEPVPVAPPVSEHEIGSRAGLNNVRANFYLLVLILSLKFKFVAFFLVLQACIV